MHSSRIWQATAALILALVIAPSMAEGEKPVHPFHEIVNLGSSHAMSNAETLKAALEMLPKEVDARDPVTGETGMLMAAKRGRKDMVEVFLSFKASKWHYFSRKQRYMDCL